MFSKSSSFFEESFISLLLVSMTLLVFAEVVARFLFNVGFLWMEEVTLTLGAWFVLFGASYGVKVGAHIGVDAFVQVLPEKDSKNNSRNGCCFYVYVIAVCFYTVVGSI